jgi:cell wall-associated NlpC family hydrolase
MTGLSARLYADLLGKPFADGARGPDAFDCVGLAIEVQRRRGLDVPNFVSDPAELHRQTAAGGFLDGCTRLNQAEAGCVALIRMGLNEHHLGVMVDAYKVLHTTAQTKGVVVERILSHLWQRRIVGFYKLETPKS